MSAVPSTEFIPVDWPSATHAPEVVAVLAQRGLHPVYDERPLHAVRGKSFAKTTIYVPAAESEQARVLLATWYTEQSGRVHRMTSGFWRGLLAPAAIALIAGAAVGLACTDFGMGMVGAFLAFIPAIAVWYRKREETA